MVQVMGGGGESTDWSPTRQGFPPRLIDGQRTPRNLMSLRALRSTIHEVLLSDGLFKIDIAYVRQRAHPRETVREFLAKI